VEPATAFQKISNLGWGQTTGAKIAGKRSMESKEQKSCECFTEGTEDDI